MEKWSTRLFKLTSLFAVFLTDTRVSLLNFSKKKKKEEMISLIEESFSKETLMSLE